MTRENYNFANLTDDQLNELMSVEQKINQKENKEVIILAYTK